MPLKRSVALGREAAAPRLPINLDAKVVVRGRLVGRAHSTNRKSLAPATGFIQRFSVGHFVFGPSREAILWNQLERFGVWAGCSRARFCTLSGPKLAPLTHGCHSCKSGTPGTDVALGKECVEE